MTSLSHRQEPVMITSGCGTTGLWRRMEKEDKKQNRCAILGRVLLPTVLPYLLSQCFSASAPHLSSNLPFPLPALHNDCYCYGNIICFDISRAAQECLSPTRTSRELEVGGKMASS